MQGSISKTMRIFTWALFAVSAAIALGQGTSASLTGQVTDSAGAALPDATVTARNTATNLMRTVTSNQEGIYQIAPLPPGNYSLSVEATGFRHYVQSGIVLSVSLASTLNVTLHPGSKDETVTVIADAELINTTSAELGETVNEFSVTQLPLNGRDPSSLVFLAPGVTNVLNSNGALQAGFSFPTETGGSANGGRQGSTFYMLDGVPNMDNYLLLTAPFPNADATQEFRVITNNFNASYGFAPGAVVSIQTKSGSNDFHGGVFEFLRNQDLNAKNPFSNAVDPLRRNQFGGYLGGPVLKNKLFFFGNYQGTRLNSASTANKVNTPTAAMLNGDFTGVAQTLKGPFVGNKIDPALYNQAAVTLAKTALPLSTAPDGLEYYSGATTINNFDEVTGRLDYDLSSRQRIALRSFVDRLSQPSGDVNGNILSVLNLNPWGYVMGEKMWYVNEVLNHTWTINPTTVNVISVFWNQMSAHSSAVVKDSSGQDVCFSRYIKVNELPGSCYVEGLNVNGAFQTGWTEPSQELRTTYGVYDDFTKTIGNHTLTFGVDLQHQFAEEYSQYPTQPIIQFSGNYTGNGLADFLLGDMYSFEQGAGEIASVTGWQPGFYGQDQYRLKPNLTLTAGLRWDPNIPPASAGGRGAAYIPGETSRQFPNSPAGLVFPGDPGVTNGLMPTTYGYWEPRVGIAWQPKSLPRTSIHAGFGLFTAPLMYSMYNHAADISPFSPTYTFYGSNSTPLNFSDPWSSFSGTGGVSPFPPFTSISNKPSSAATFATPVSVEMIFSNDFHLGITQSWNASVDQDLGHNMAFHIAYVGSESYHQSDIIDQNPGQLWTAANPSLAEVRGNPNFGNILTDFSNGTASYHALQATFDKHMSHGLQFQSNFTWSKVLDIASSGNVSFGTNQLPNPYDLKWNRGISSLNVPLISVSSLIYQTPSLKTKGVLVSNTLGGWEASAIITSQSGSPFGINAGDDNSGSLQANQDRADATGQPIRLHPSGNKWNMTSKGSGYYFNPGAFTANAKGTFGNTGKNIFKGPAVNSTDLALMKNWTLVEKYALQFRCEMFNAFNHVNLGTPVSTVGWGNYGQITGIGYIPPRVMQGALKFTF